MALKISIRVEVCDSERTNYKDPNGIVDVELFANELEEIAGTLDTITSAAARVARVKYLAALNSE